MRHVYEAGGSNVLTSPGYSVGKSSVAVFKTVVQSRSMGSWELSAVTGDWVE